MLLIIYNKKICREYLLPNIHDADYCIELSQREFGIKSDVRVTLQRSQRGWEFVENGRDVIKEGNNVVSRVILVDGLILKVTTPAKDILYMIVAGGNPGLNVMKKLYLSKVGRVTVGSGEDNGIRYNFNDLTSSNHACFFRQGNTWYVTDNSKNGLFVNHQKIQETVRLNLGDEIYLFGLRLLYMGDLLLVGANCGVLDINPNAIPRLDPIEIRERPEETIQKKEEVYYNRSPRNLPSIFSSPVEIEGPPAPKQLKQKPAYMVIGPAFTMAIPMMLGCLMAVYASSVRGTGSSAFMYTGLITAGGAAIVGTIWAVLNLNYSRKEAAEDEALRFNSYSNYLIEIANTLRSQYQHNTIAMNKMYPAASEVLSYGRGSSALWNRNFTHKDFLYVRLGLGERPFQVEITVPKEKFSLINDALANKPRDIKNEYSILKQVPVGINLQEKRLVGLIGGPGKRGCLGTMQVIAAQIAATHCYTDVKMVFIYDENEKDVLDEWECMRWFPHVWSEDRGIRYLAANELEIHDIFFDLHSIVRTRAEEAERPGTRNGATVPRPHYILFISDPSVLEGELLAKYVYDAKPEYGLTTIMMVETLAQLPNACETVIENTPNGYVLYDLMDIDQEHRIPYIPDKVTGNQLLAFGQSLADIRVKELEISSEIPSSLTFLEMYNVKTLAELEVEDRWRRNRSYNSMRALIGKKAGNSDCYLDIHEKFHGPHGLIAGTTGSGKSETLQTWILSLAVNFSPEDVSFFIIDFKGGGMANLFSNLPHLAGQISNLSGNQVSRAMISIKSENRRRQAIFAQYGVNNINLYTNLYKSHEADLPIPHLFIIIDEFAELKHEEPEFMQELISVAQVGRSLGVHLILATQRPNGTVDDNIRSNAKFRLCLRVQDRQDSIDMLHKPDAAFLTQAGRCYLQVGNDELFELFQSGYSGAIYSDVQEKTHSAALITRSGKTTIVGGRKPAIQIDGGARKQKTQLDAVIEYLGQLAEKMGYAKSPQLWLPVLGKSIFLDDLTENEQDLTEKDHHYIVGRGWYDNMKEGWNIRTVMGTYDDPEQQAQRPLVLDLSENGHLALLGGVVSGKSTFLQTMVYSLIRKYTPDQLVFYLIDFSSHMMTPFENAPHVGGVVTELQEDKLKKFFHMLNEIMNSRRALFSGGNYNQYVQAYGIRLPAICVILDNYSSFREKTNNAYENIILRLAREGIGYGIYFVLSSAGFGHADIPTRLGDSFRYVISLEQTDKFKYMDALRRTRLTIIPESNIKGRGLAPVGERVLEFQTALALPAHSDFERSQLIEKMCLSMKEEWTGRCADAIPEIPANPTYTLISQDPRYQTQIADTRWLPYGYRMQDASILGLDLSRNFSFIIAGKARTGKTNVLKLMIHAAAAKKASICIIEKGGGARLELDKLSAQYGADYVTDSSELYRYLVDLKPEFVARNKVKHALVLEGAEDQEIFDAVKKERPIFIFAADMTDFMTMAYKPAQGVPAFAPFLENIADKGALHNIYIIGCLKIDDVALLGGYRAFNLMTAYKKGMYLGGPLAQQRLFTFQNLGPQVLQRVIKKGFAYVSDDEEEGCGVEAVIPIAK